MFGPVRFDQRPETAQTAAQAAGGHAHLVHRVRQVTPDPDILKQEPSHMFGDVGPDGVTGAIVGSDVAEFHDVRRRRCPGPDRCCCLGRGPRDRAVLLQRVDDGLDQGALGGLGSECLDLDLAETRSHVFAVEDAHGVVDEFQSGLALGVGDDERRPFGAQMRHRRQVLLAGQRGQGVAKDLGHVSDRALGQRHLDLVANPLAFAHHRELDVPPGIVAALAPAQRDAPAEQAQVFGVVVDRVEFAGLTGFDGPDPLDPGQVGKSEQRVHAQLLLDFAVSGR